MLKSETYLLEDAIGKLITAAANREREAYLRWHRHALEALPVFEKRVTEHFFGNSKQLPLVRYIRFHQAALTKMSDELYLSLKKADVSWLFGLPDPNEVVESINDILRRWEFLFGEAFDTSVPCTLYYCERCSEQLQPHINQIRDIDLADESFKRLSEAITNSIEDLLKPHPGSRPSYNDVMSAERFAGQTANFLETTTTAPDGLFDQLYRENFNSTAFVQWYQDRLLQMLSELNADEREDRVFQEEHRLMITGTLPKAAFDPRRENISDQLSAWLSRLHTHLIANRPVWHNISRLPLELSVAQFGLFLRLCHFTGCFHEQNISAILRFFNQHFTSKKQNHISLKSLAKAFYSAELSTAASNRALLQRMIDHINKKYFPK